MKKILALALAALMLIGMMSVAFAAEGAPSDTSISVSGLETGDTVNFYQVLKYDETATATGGWVNATGFTLTNAQIQKMLGLDSTGKPVTITDANRNDYGIDAALAATITGMAQTAGKTAAKFKNVAVSEGSATQATTAVGDAGLYLALVTPGTVDYLYNPVFVAADYTAGGTNTQAAVTALSYNPEALAKKEQITLTKEIDGTADTKYDVNVGDTVPFTISTKVPAYSSAYKDQTYVITDTMESGLEVQGTPAVTVAGITLAETDYEVEVAANKLSFTVTMKQSGLDKVAATGTAQAITVAYNAKVTSVENATVTEKENEATVKFSNNPEDKTSYSLLEDKTRNYSFTIDGSLLGYTGESYETDELIKVGKKADGSWITETTKYRSGTEWTDLAPLAGAKFALYKSEPAADDYANEAAARASSKLYTNDVFTGIVESDSTGRLKIEGLDADEYWLREVSAPAGYIADNRTFHITIAATYTTINGGEYMKDVNNTPNDATDDIKVKYDAYKVLDGYTVTVNDGTANTVSTYDIENAGPTDHKKVDKATYQKITGEDFAGDAVTPINNTQGTQLPSTGGVGTTILYIGGSILVLAAVILLVTKRRMKVED